MIIIDNVELSKNTLAVNEPFILSITLHEKIEFSMTLFHISFHTLDGVTVTGIWDDDHEIIMC